MGKGNKRERARDGEGGKRREERDTDKYTDR